jgi:amino acid adenylation domain-containing protein
MYKPVAEVKKTTRSRAIPKQSRNDDEPTWFPLSFGQEQMWVAQQLVTEGTPYNIPFQLRLRGRLDVAALQQTLDELQRRHEIFRTTYTLADNQPVQIVAAPKPVALPLIDLCDRDATEREAEARRLASEEARRPFDLLQGPLLRCLLLRLDAEDHIVLANMHHIVCDGWSLYVTLTRELALLYNAFSSGQSSPLAELPIQYADFACWERERLQGELLESRLAYWKQQLHDLPTLALPLDRPRPPVRTGRGERPKMVLSTALTNALRTLGSESNATLFMTLLAAFQTLLGRYSGQDDIVIGSVIANRGRSELRGLMGFLVNTVVLRGDLAGDPTFRELLSRARAVALAAYTRHEMPFRRLVQELQPVRVPGRSSLFQAFIVYEPPILSPQEQAWQGVERSYVEIETGSSIYDLTLQIVEQGGSLTCSFVYNSDLFDAATIRRMMGHFQTLLEGIVANPDRRLSQLPLLSATERAQLCKARNGISPHNAFVPWAPEDIEQTIAQRFEQQVKQAPQHIAVETLKYRWSYDEVNQRANRAAHHIVQHCASAPCNTTSCDDGPQRVALLFEHDAPMIAGLLGVLKAGKTYVPLDASYPEERLTHVLQDCGASAILTNSHNFALAQSIAGDTLPLINTDEMADDTGTSENIKVLSSPSDAAYILYTSGSTGQPKGVVQSHRNVLGHIRNYTNNLHINAQDRLTLFSSYGFDAAVMDIFAALLNGATLYPINIKEDGVASLSRKIVDCGITIYHSTPTVYRYFTSTLQPGEKLPTVRLMVLGGEEVNTNDVELYKQHFSEHCLFVNGLGPTESTVTLQYIIDQQTPLSRSVVPVGYPVEDTEVLLLNESGDEVEMYGEIAVKSPYIALGYWRQSELTRAAFRSDPNDGSRQIYRTGDMGRYLPDGTLEFMGRKDFQVKIRGYRIELREVECVLGQHPAVREALVVAQSDERGEQRLSAYVMPLPGATVSADELRCFARSKTPEYMVPSAFVLLDNLPLTPNGKVDRRALPPPHEEQCNCQQTSIAPHDEVETRLVEIWESLLNVRPIGVRDNFFELGGHSLLAVNLLAHMQKEFGCRLSLGALFQMPTVEQVASFIRHQDERETHEAAAPALTPLQPHGSRIPFFLVHDVSGTLWCYRALARHLGPEQPVYGFQASAMKNKSSSAGLCVEEVAADYVRELRDFQPQGPYYLGGFSLGGALAFEMAQQLRQQGQEVALLAMLDAGYPGMSKRRATLARKLWIGARNLRYISRYDVLNLYRIRVLNQIRRRHSAPSSEELMWRALIESAALHELPQAFHSYKVRPYAGRMVMFRPKLHFRVFEDHLGWGRIATGGVQVHQVPGSHETMVMEPHVRHLAARLKRYLDTKNPQNV